MESNQGHVSPVPPEDNQEKEPSKKKKTSARTKVGIVATTAAAITVAVIASNGGGSNPNQTPDPSGTASTPVESPSASASPSETAPVLTNHEILLAEMTNETAGEFFLRDAPVRAEWCDEVIYPDIQDLAATIQSVNPGEFTTLPEATTTNTPQEILNIWYYHELTAFPSHHYADGEGIPKAKPTDDSTEFTKEITRKVMSCSYVDMTSPGAVAQDQYISDQFDAGMTGRGAAYYANQPVGQGIQYISSEPASTTNGYWSESITGNNLGTGVVLADNYARVEYTYKDPATGVESTRYTYMSTR